MRHRSSALALVCCSLAVSSGAEGARAQAATFASFTGATGLPVQRFDIDFAHSAVEFTVRFMGLTRVRGAFAEFRGTLMLDTAEVTGSSVAVVINAASISTNLPARDRDLRSPNFFDAEKFPQITFTTSSIERRPDGLLLRGPLTMHGVTREVAIPVTVLHPLSKDAWGNRRIGYVGSLALSRKEYGILGTAFWNSEFDPGRMSVSDEVTIELTLEAEVNNVDTWDTPKGDSVRIVAASQGSAKTLQEFRAAASDTASAPGRFADLMLNAAGLKLMHHAQYKDATEFYRLATELRPARAPLHAALGEAYLMSGRRTEALASFRQALALDSTNTVALEYLRHLGAR
jgi:polyisoprenoid-binding protein YceI